MTAHAFPTGTILGYPRIGRRRELKKAVEAFWAGTIDAAELEAAAAELRAATRERLASLGLGRDDSSIPESFSFYDQVLVAAVTVEPPCWATAGTAAIRASPDAIAASICFVISFSCEPGLRSFVISTP